MTNEETNSEKLHRILDQLRKPFDPSQVSWKPGAVKGDRAMALAYADLRAYMNRLDEVCGADWSVAYEPWGEDRIICRLTICGVTRSSTGEMSAQDEKNEMGGTVAEAQSMKRACVMFGLSRYLYNLPSGWYDFDPSTKRFTDQAKAKLTGMLTQHYRKATEDKSAQRASVQSTSAADNPFEDSTPAYVLAFQNLTGKDYDFIKWTKTLHAKSNGPCTPAQYGYLVGIMDKLTNKQHGYALSLLCQSEIGKDNLPGEKVAANLIALLPTTVKNDAGEDVPNPTYRADIAAMVTAFSLMKAAA